MIIEKGRELECFGAFYETLNDFQKVKLNMNEVNKELFSYVSNFYHESKDASFPYYDIKIVQKQDFNDLLNSIVIQSKQRKAEIEEVNIKVDLKPIKEKLEAN